MMMGGFLPSQETLYVSVWGGGNMISQRKTSNAWFLKFQVYYINTERFGLVLRCRSSRIWLEMSKYTLSHSIDATNFGKIRMNAWKCSKMYLLLFWMESKYIKNNINVYISTFISVATFINFNSQFSAATLGCLRNSPVIYPLFEIEIAPFWDMKKMCSSAK